MKGVALMIKVKKANAQKLYPIFDDMIMKSIKEGSVGKKIDDLNELCIFFRNLKAIALGNEDQGEVSVDNIQGSLANVISNNLSSELDKFTDFEDICLIMEIYNQLKQNAVVEPVTESAVTKEEKTEAISEEISKEPETAEAAAEELKASENTPDDTPEEIQEETSDEDTFNEEISDEEIPEEEEISDEQEASEEPVEDPYIDSYVVGEEDDESDYSYSSSDYNDNEEETIEEEEEETVEEKTSYDFTSILHPTYEDELETTDEEENYKAEDESESFSFDESSSSYSDEETSKSSGFGSSTGFKLDTSSWGFGTSFGETTKFSGL